jgi:hypothetical protein
MHSLRNQLLIQQQKPLGAMSGAMASRMVLR